MPTSLFDDAFMRLLPGESGPTRQPREVRRAAFSLAEPTPISSPQLAVWVPEVASLLNLEPPEPGSPWHQALAGNALVPGMRPYAACYGGHQFGHWAGQLGDGRAITLCEVLENGQRHEIQLKGAGPTPFSRRADGRAVLRSSIRELLCSEAMFHLGVPTTRALCLMTSPDTIVRDMFYDGHPRLEPLAIVTRVAPTFLRFGSFELPASRGDHALLEQLLDWTLAHHYPSLDRNALFPEVCRRTAVMIAHWMAHGFVHGVMNTDNFSILGLTIDYGPYGWLDDYDPAFTPNTTDLPGRRYAFGRQPSIAMWNLARLGEALSPLIASDLIDAGLDLYRTTVQATWSELMAKKLGLEHVPTPATEAVLSDLLAFMGETSTDWTLFFRALSEVPIDDAPADLLRPLGDAFYDPLSESSQEALLAWLKHFITLAREAPDLSLRKASMDRHNAWFIPRNYLVQQAIDRAHEGDFSEVHRLLELSRTPYTARPDLSEYHRKRPEWARHRAGCSALSCSS